MHVNWSAGKGAQEGSSWTYALAGFPLSLGLEGGETVFRGEGWSVWRTEMSLGTEDPGSPIAFPAICSEMWPCQESLPSSDRRARHPASIFPSTGAKNHKGKEENLYIYNIKSLGD